jgi:Fic family protein
METYKKTHPWITFTANLREASPKLWIMLGECHSKCQHIEGVPLRPDTARELYQIYLAKGALATTAIEGNTLSDEEALKRVEGQLKLPPSREYLGQEIDNVVAACGKVLADLKVDAGACYTTSYLKQLNGLILKGLPLNEGVVPGVLRSHSVGVGRYRGAPAEECEHLLEQLFSWLRGPDFKGEQDLRIVYAIIKAVLAHLYIAWIHPFGDGNGRTARLLEFMILLESGVPASSAHLFSNHYNQTRTEYYRQLDAASRSGGDVLPFLGYAVQGFVDGLREQISRIRDQQWDVTWRNYVHEKFRDEGSSTSKRCRDLVLDLSRQAEELPASSIAGLTPRLAKSYAGKTSKTIARDLNRLLKMNLVVRTGKGYRANKELVLAFLPERIQSSD